MTLSQAFDKFESEYGKGSTILLEEYNDKGNEPVHIVYGNPYIRVYLLGKGGIVAMVKVPE